MTNIPDIQGFELLSPLAQDRLRDQVAAENGDVKHVAASIQAQLDNIDTANVAADPEAHRRQQADRAFLLAQLTYLARLEEQIDATQPT